MLDLRRRSLVRRLILIAGIWTLLVVVIAGVFLTVAIISRNVWTQVRQWIATQRVDAAARAIETAGANTPAPSGPD